MRAYKHTYEDDSNIIFNKKEKNRELPLTNHSIASNMQNRIKICTIIKQLRKKIISKNVIKIQDESYVETM